MKHVSLRTYGLAGRRNESALGVLKRRNFMSAYDRSRKTVFYIDFPSGVQVAQVARAAVALRYRNLLSIRVAKTTGFARAEKLINLNGLKTH